jgi:transcriptional regulator with XRE-family HTH domain
MTQVTRRVTIAELIRSYRNQVGLTQAEVAAELGYETAQFISNWERNLAIPPTYAWRTLARVLRIPPNEVIKALQGHRMKAVADELREVSDLLAS